MFLLHRTSEMTAKIPSNCHAIVLATCMLSSASSNANSSLEHPPSTPCCYSPAEESASCTEYLATYIGTPIFDAEKARRPAKSVRSIYNTAPSISFPVFRRTPATVAPVNGSFIKCTPCDDCPREITRILNQTFLIISINNLDPVCRLAARHRPPSVGADTRCILA